MRAPSLSAAVLFTVVAGFSLIANAIQWWPIVGAVVWPVIAAATRWAAYGIQRTAHERLVTAERRLTEQRQRRGAS